MSAVWDEKIKRQDNETKNKVILKWWVRKQAKTNILNAKIKLKIQNNTKCKFKEITLNVALQQDLIILTF